jgi:hypothetical protein
MKYREFTLTEKGKLIAKFFNSLADDYSFKPNEPMTDTYVQEVCYEAGFSKEETLIVIDELVGMEIIK